MEKLSEVENLIYKFDFFHLGEKLLVTDFIENYDEVFKLFSKQNKTNKYAVQSSFVLNNLVNGKYDVFVYEQKYDKWGLRVKKITFFNSLYDYEYNKNIDENKWEILFNIGIDAGSCLFLSDCVLENCDKLNNFFEQWMGKNYKGNILKLDNNQTSGFGTSSGYGDGLYEFKVYKDNDNIIGLEVEFINDDLQKEYYSEDDEEGNGSYEEDSEDSKDSENSENSEEEVEYNSEDENNDDKQKKYKDKKYNVTAEF